MSRRLEVKWRKGALSPLMENTYFTICTERSAKSDGDSSPEAGFRAGYGGVVWSDIADTLAKKSEF